ncbi:MAG TPA: RagB/SusD family nutrient uptake outer membrane protein [Niabella sp.]|nr:RagB/SusD family nutrient uptake outer membrane protein [Niabella sp.]
MKQILFLILVALSFASCKKFLKADSPSNFDQQYVFNTVPDARKAVNSIYALFNQDAFTSRISNVFMGNTDVEMGGVGASPDNSRRDIWSFEVTSNNSDLLSVWNNAFKAINLANECEEGLVNVSLANDPTNKDYKQLLGETKALRAVWYYMLMNHWGDVPFSIKPSRAGDDFYLPRTGRDTILTYLINDLIEIEPDMYWADQLSYGIEQVNREFVIGMIARLALVRGGYWLYPDMTMQRKSDYKDYITIARNYSQKLIDLKPRNMSDFATVFMNENKYIKPVNDDVLYEVAFYPGSGDVAWCNGVRVDAGTHPYGSGSSYLTFLPYYYHSFDTTDLRLPVTCFLVYYDSKLIQQTTGISISPGKWNRLNVPSPLGAASAKGTGINWPMMRYADVLLMLAESENELNGPNAVAQNALKLVRRRAFPSNLWAEKVDSYVNTVSVSKESFFNAIVDERAWEFGGECIRKYDLERWNLFGKKIAEIRNESIQMGVDAVAGTGKYANLPDYMYYKRDSATGVVTFLNPYSKVAAAPPVIDVPNKGDNPKGYYRLTWLRSLYNTTTSGPADVLIRNWRGYPDNTGASPVRYVLPLHNSVLTASKGSLQNQYGY